MPPDPKSKYLDMLKKSAVVPALFIIQDVVLALVLEEDRFGLVVTGFMFAFAVLLFTIAATILAKEVGYDVDWPAILETSALVVVLFIVTDAIIYFIPEDKISTLIYIGYFFAFFAYSIIIIGRFLYEMAKPDDENRLRFLKKNE